jgi:hypothetical protein
MHAYAGDKLHRKVHVYWPYVDELDDDLGHGTHVSGSVGGDPRPVEGVDDAVLKHHGILM